ncbi:uncharacterized protein LOC115414857 [Sphaeramia orbicularis]|uniref:uncharacterized protein LOC115414857 n=1 Tax=Sphaeramia orbicularis TaxID=375764 RepID=UPI00117CA45C|nr:uncharacterized protein LOC115414857 [Sphaeramia orbicularis]
MDETSWIKILSFLFLLPQFAVAVGVQYSFPNVLSGDDATLSCGNVILSESECGSTNWSFTHFGLRVNLVEYGRILENTTVHSDRLRLTSNCSLVIKDVTAEDVGFYYCQQDKYGKEELNTWISLSVINMHKQEYNEKMTLSCSVLSPGWCKHTLTWLYGDKAVDENSKDTHMPRHRCFANVTVNKSKGTELFKCQVRDNFNTTVHMFPLSPRSKDVYPDWLRTTIVSVGLTALILCVVGVNLWAKFKGKKTQTDNNAVMVIQ